MVVPRPRSLRSKPSSRSTRSASRTVCRETSYCSVRAISPGKPSSNAPSATRRRISALTCAHRGSGLERSGSTGPDPEIQVAGAVVIDVTDQLYECPDICLPACHSYLHQEGQATDFEESRWPINTTKLSSSAADRAGSALPPG